MKRIVFALATALLLGSCGIYGKYKRSADLPVQSLYPEELRSASGDSANLGQLPWQEVFTDPILQGLIEEGLRNNLDLRTAYLRLEQAEAGLSSARLAYLPTLALAPQGQISKVEGNASSRTYSLMASASWQIDVFGSLTTAKRRSKALVEASDAYRQAVETQVISGVARSYYTLVLLDEQLRVSLETERLWAENVRVMRALMQAGRYNDAAVSSSEANYAQIRASVLALRQQIREAESALSVLLGTSVRSFERGRLEQWRQPQLMSVGLPISLLAQRPDLRRAEQSLAAAFYATGSARSAFYPNITLTGTGGWTNSLGGLIVNPAQLLLNAVAGLTQPIFQGGRLRAQYKVAKSQQQEAYLAFVQTLLSAGAEVNNLATQVQSYTAQAALYDEQVKALQRSTKATRLLMDSGSSTYLEVLTAEQGLLQAQLTALTNRFNEINSTISLYQALGGGRESSLGYHRAK